MRQDPVGADRVVEQKHVMMRHSQDTWKNTMKERRGSHDAVPILKRRPVISHHHHAVGQTEQTEMCSTGRKTEQDIDMNNDDKEKQSPTPEKSHVTVSRNSKRQRLSSIATHRSKPQHARVSTFWDHVDGGELSALEMEHLNKMKVVERVPYSFINLKTNGIHRSRLVAKEFRCGSKIDGFMNFSATPPHELVKLMISMVATARWDQTAWVWIRGTREQFSDRDDAHGHQQSVLSRSMQRREIR